ncbi:MaoC family dehydratase [Paracoccus sp. KR1-242]|uniref:MaoC family dehydratase n=1 Tax=Paracoccus sp. KR1-242 TaxID=3410028 RepID=UPI003C0C96D0
MYDIRNIDEFSVGDRVSVAKTVTEADGAMYIAATGDFGPVHVDEGYASTTRFGERLAPGILVAGICTSVLTAELVGTVGVSIRDCFWFTGAVRYGDTLTFDIWISGIDPANRTVDWQASAKNEEGVEVLKADATLKFPRKKVIA